MKTNTLIEDRGIFHTCVRRYYIFKSTNLSFNFQTPWTPPYVVVDLRGFVCPARVADRGFDLRGERECNSHFRYLYRAAAPQVTRNFTGRFLGAAGASGLETMVETMMRIFIFSFLFPCIGNWECPECICFMICSGYTGHLDFCQTGRLLQEVTPITR